MMLPSSQSLLIFSLPLLQQPNSFLPVSIFGTLFLKWFQEHFLFVNAVEGMLH